jgi:hypothetical protein
LLLTLPKGTLAFSKAACTPMLAATRVAASIGVQAAFEKAKVPFGKVSNK